MELGSKHAVVMTRDGEFIRVARRRQTWQLGDEVDVPNLVRKRPILMTSIASACAAAVIILFVLMTGPGGIGGPGQPVVAAYITMDINPSMELSVDADEIVLEARGLNDDGIAVLAGLSLKGIPLEEAADLIVDRAAELDYFNKYTELGAGTILITSTSVLDEPEAEEEEFLERVTQRVKDTMVAKHPEEAQVFEVESLAAPKELRDEAEKNGVSVGKLAIQILVEEQGKNTDEDRAAGTTVQDIAQSVENVGKLLQETKKQDKEQWKQLLEAYKQRHPDQVSADVSSEVDAEDEQDEKDILKQNDSKGNGNGSDRANGNGNGNGNGKDKGEKNEEDAVGVGVGIRVDVDTGKKNQGSDKSVDDRDDHKNEDKGKGKEKDKGKQEDEEKSVDRKLPEVSLDIELDLDLGVLKEIKDKVEQRIEKERAKHDARDRDKERDEDRDDERDDDRSEESAGSAGSDDRFKEGLLDNLFERDREKEERRDGRNEHDRGRGNEDNGKGNKEKENGKDDRD